MLAGLCKANLLSEYNSSAKKTRYIFGKHKLSKKKSKQLGFKLKYKITSESESSEDDEEGIYIASDYSHPSDYNDRSALVKRSLPSDSTENPAYGISPYWPYYCDCCSCCCDSDSESDLESESSCSITSEESISLSCSSVSSTTSSDDENSDELYPYTRHSDISYEEIRKSETESKNSSQFIQLDLMEKRQPDLTISTEVKLGNGNCECIQVKLSNVQLDRDSVVTLKRSSSVGRAQGNQLRRRVSGRRKADSWAGAQQTLQSTETPSFCRGRRDEKKNKISSVMSDLTRVEEVSDGPSKMSKDNSVRCIDQQVVANRSESNIYQNVVKEEESKRKSRSLELFKQENLSYFGNTMDTDENKLVKMDRESENKSNRNQNKLKPSSKSESVNLEKSLMDSSENNPANIPMVVMQSCQLHLSLNPASRDTILVPMGTIVNALYKYEDNLRVKTPHGDEGLLKFINCAPLVSLPTVKRSETPLKDPRMSKKKPSVNIPVIKPKVINSKLMKPSNSNKNYTSPNIPKTRLLESRLKQVKNWEDSEMDKLAGQTISEPPDESQRMGMTLTEGPILTAACSYESRGRSTLSVKQGEHITLLNKDLKDWLWVRASSGAEGFLPISHVSTSTLQQTKKGTS